MLVLGLRRRGRRPVGSGFWRPGASINPPGLHSRASGGLAEPPRRPRSAPRHPAATFARTCSGFVAPEMTELTAGIASRPPTATSSIAMPRSSAKLCSASARSHRPSGISRPASRPSVASSPRRYLPVSRPLASGKYGRKPIPSLSQSGQHFVLGLALDERVVVLHGDEAVEAGTARDLLGGFDLLGGEVGRADPAHLALVDEVVERAERLLDRRRPDRAGASGRRRSRRCEGGGASPRPPSGCSRGLPRRSSGRSSIALPNFVARRTRSRRPSSARPM